MNSIVSVFWNALLTAVVTTLLAGLFVAAMPPVYRATAIVKGNADDMLKLQSAVMLQEVVKTTRADLGQLEGWLEQLMSAKTDPVNLLKEKLTISAGEEANWINISIEAQSAEAASTLANELAHRYLDQNAVVHLTPAEKAKLFTAVEEANNRLLEFLQLHPALMNASAEKARLDGLVAQAQLRKQAHTNAVLLLEEQQRAITQNEIGVMTEPGVVRAARSVDTLILERKAMSVRYGPEHLKMSAHEAKIQEAINLLNVELEAYEVRLANRMTEREKQLAQEEANLSRLDDELKQLASQQFALTSIELDKESAIRKYDGMTEQAKVELVADAVPPRNSFGVNQLLLLGLVFLMSFMLMVVLMVIRSSRRT